MPSASAHPLPLQFAPLGLALVAFMIFWGCTSKSGVDASMVQLEKAFPAISAPDRAEQPGPGQATLDDANARIRSVLAAVHSNDFAAAVLVLQVTARSPGMTAEQFMAVDQARKALITDLLNRAERKDTNAQAALQFLDQARSR
jgi:hypothetical protein